VSQKTDFRPDVEGLRGIAILAVVAFHCVVPGFGGGFVGVDIFFALSGYLITGLLVAEAQKTSRISLVGFYARRIRRLLPAAALLLLVTLLIGSTVLAPDELMFAGRAARATAIYASNLFFASNAAYYFAPDVETNPMLHTWTLAVEEQFYLFWPLLIMLGLQVWRSRKALIRCLFGLVILSLAASVWLTGYRGILAFYGLPTRAWEFGLGGLAVFVRPATLKLPGGFVALGWMGLVAILASIHAVSDPAVFPGWIALFPVLGTAAVLVGAAQRPHCGAARVLESRPLLLFGRLSYSWYLWHWPVLVFFNRFFPAAVFAGRVAACALALGAAAAVHYLIENPIRFNPILIRRPALTLYLGAALTICSLSAALLSIRYSEYLANTPRIKSISSEVGDIADMSREQCLTPEDSPVVKSCVFGQPVSATNIVLFGDSHARQWFNPLRKIAASHGWKLTTMLRASCPATDIRPPGLSTTLANYCVMWRTEAMRRIVALDPALVFIGNATYYLGRRDRPAGRVVSIREWREGTRRTLGTLSSAGLPVVSIRDNPLAPFDVPMCLERAARHPWYSGRSCEFQKSEALNPAVFEAEKAGASGLTRVHFLDLTDHFCRGDICPAVQGTTVVYRDDNHLTGKYADTLTPALDAELEPIVAVPHP
jgi:peptidoglycan/LPS O-acetylase OafA/YrhL